jgi:hypothetical protein
MRKNINNKQEEEENGSIYKGISISRLFFRLRRRISPMLQVPSKRQERNKEVDNTNLPLSRTEPRITQSPIQNQENYEKSLKPHPKYLENKNQKASSLNSYEGTRSRTKQIYKFKSDLVT